MKALLLLLLISVPQPAVAQECCEWFFGVCREFCAPEAPACPEPPPREDCEFVLILGGELLLVRGDCSVEIEVSPVEAIDAP